MGFRENVVNTLFTKIFLLCFGLCSSIIYARVLGPHAFGQGVLLMIFPPIFVKLMNLGVAGSLTYFLGQNPDEKKAFIGTALSFAIPVGLISLFVLLALESYLFHNYYKSDIPRDLLRLVFLFTPLHAFQFYFRVAIKALNRIKEFNLYSEVLPTIIRFFLTILLLGVLQLGVAAYIALEILISLITTLCFARILHKEGVLLLRFDTAKFKLMLHYGLRGFFTNMSAALSSKIDRLVIGGFLSPSAAGIYAIAENLAGKLLIVANSICLPLLPQLSKISRAEATLFANKILNQILLPVAFMIIATVSASPFAIEFIYGKDFATAWQPFFFLALAAQFISLNKVVGAYFVATGRPGIKSLQKAAVLGIRCILLVALVPAYNTVGCGISTFVAECFVFLLTYVYYKRVEELGGTRIFTFSISTLRGELRNVTNKVAKRTRKLRAKGSP